MIHKRTTALQRSVKYLIWFHIYIVWEGSCVKNEYHLAVSPILYYLFFFQIIINTFETLYQVKIVIKYQRTLTFLC